MADVIDLSDKTVIVTGAGHGIGEATAKAFAKHDANVVVNDLGVSDDGNGSDPEPAGETAEAIVDSGGSASAHFGDVSEMEYCETLVADSVDQFGSVDTVINFAGILRDNFLVNMSESDWDDVIRVHLKGHFALLRAAGRHWRQAHKENDGFETEKSFIAVSSAAARGNPGQLNYSAAKAGILGLMRTGARELNRYEVRVNALMPVAMTRMLDDIPEEHLPDVEEGELAPERVAPMAVFLGSNRAKNVTGCTLACGGEGMLYVTDPEFRSSSYMNGGWTPEEIAAKFPQLTGFQETAKLEQGGLLNKIV